MKYKFNDASQEADVDVEVGNDTYVIPKEEASSISRRWENQMSHIVFEQGG